MEPPVGADADGFGYHGAEELGVKLEDLEEKPKTIEPANKVSFEDNYKPVKSEAMQRVEAMSEVNRLYIAGQHVKSKELADKWGIDVFED